MNILYIDSRMGISGAKLLGALVDMMEQPDIFIRQFNDLGFDGIRAERRAASDGAVSGTRIEFTRTDHEDEDEDEDEEEIEETGGFFSFGRPRSQRHSSHSHSVSDRTLEDVKEMINELSLSGRVRKRAIGIYEMIAKAASKSHNKPVNEVKLHRAGPRDVIASVVGVCMILEDMHPDKIICSPITVGSGYVSAARGRIPVPTPTLKLILGDTPYLAGKEEGELCTLEGAAILKVYVSEFVDMPELAILRTGAGIGIRSFENGSNCVKLHLGTEVKTSANTTVTELEAALFNDTAEALKITGERLKAVGAEEMYTVPIAQLTGGVGTLLKCICQNDLADDAAREILKNTSAIYVRRTAVSAYRADVKTEIIESSSGSIEVERITGFGISRTIPAANEVEKAARANNISIREAYDTIVKEI